MIITVYEGINNENNNPNKVITKSKDIICPIFKIIVEWKLLIIK